MTIGTYRSTALRFLQVCRLWNCCLALVTAFPSSILSQTSYTPYSFTTVAGLAGVSGNADGAGNTARFNQPADVAVDSTGNVYVAEVGSHTIRKITPGGVVSTIAGVAGSSGSSNGDATSARFSSPTGLALDSQGNLFIVDSGNHTIRKLSTNGMVSTFAGLAGQFGSVDGIGSAARFNRPTDLGRDAADNLYVADTGNHTIRKITPEAVVSTLAGLAHDLNGDGMNDGAYADGLGDAARFADPVDVAVDRAGNLLVADPGNSVIRGISPSGLVTTLAGMAGSPGSMDGTGDGVRFEGPFGIALDQAANAYVSDNSVVRKLMTDGVVTTLAGIPGNPGSSDGIGNMARFNLPSGLAVDDSGNLHVADFENHTIRRGTPAANGNAPDSVAGRAYQYFVTAASRPEAIGSSLITAFSEETFELPARGVFLEEIGTYLYSKTGPDTATATMVTTNPPLAGLQRTVSLLFETTVSGTFAYSATGGGVPEENGSGVFTNVANARQMVLIPQLLANDLIRILFRYSDASLPSNLGSMELQWRSSLPDSPGSAWQSVTSGLFLTNGFVAFDEVGIVGQSSRFYRVLEHSIQIHP